MVWLSVESKLIALEEVLMIIYSQVGQGALSCRSVVVVFVWFFTNKSGNVYHFFYELSSKVSTLKKNHTTRKMLWLGN